MSFINIEGIVQRSSSAKDDKGSEDPKSQLSKITSPVCAAKATKKKEVVQSPSTVLKRANKKKLGNFPKINGYIKRTKVDDLNLLHTVRLV